MAKTIRIVCLLALLLSSVIVVQAQDDEIVLEPLTSEQFGFSGLVPQGWPEVSPGVYSGGGMIVLVQQSAPMPITQLQSLLLGQLGLQQFPESVGKRVTAALDWDLYEVRIELPTGSTVAVDLALAQVGNVSYVVLLQADAGDAPALYEALFLPVVDALTPLLVPLPPYSNAESFSEQDVSFGLENWELPGTLSIPNGEGPFAAVVIVHGSGPQSRDGRIGPSAVYRDLAHGLASNGVAVLRYDKRTLVHGQQMVEAGQLSIYDETIDDALLAVDFLRTQENIDPQRIFVLGHSQGGMTAPTTGRMDPQIAGLIIMAGTLRPFEEVLLAQLDYLQDFYPEADENTQAIYDELRATTDGLTALRAGANPAEAFDDPVMAAYWQSMAALDPAGDARELAMPVLVLQGERDYQVTMDDFALWQEVLANHPDATFISYPELHHTFMATGDTGRMALPPDYGEPGFVADQVIEDILAWLAER